MIPLMDGSSPGSQELWMHGAIRTQLCRRGSMIRIGANWVGRERTGGPHVGLNVGPAGVLHTNLLKTQSKNQPHGAQGRNRTTDTAIFSPHRESSHHFLQVPKPLQYEG